MLQIWKSLGSGWEFAEREKSWGSVRIRTPVGFALPGIRARGGERKLIYMVRSQLTTKVLHVRNKFTGEYSYRPQKKRMFSIFKSWPSRGARLEQRCLAKVVRYITRPC
jgi:hypothetical protein